MSKGEALREAIRRKWGHGGVNQIAEKMQKKRQTIGAWMKGEQWPKGSEPLLEKYLDLPAGFFERITQGVSYEDALNSSDGDGNGNSQIVNADPAIEQMEISVAEYRELLRLAPSDPIMAERLERVRDHVRNQIRLMLELAISSRAAERKARKKPENN